jgi:hypothetical protein
MNKNFSRTCIGLAVGGSLLVTSTVMGMASGPTGYEALKAVVKNSDKIKNATFSVSGSLIDNNKEFMKLDSTLKVEQDELVSGEILIDTDKLDKSYTFFASKNNMIFKDDNSDVYNRITSTEKAKVKVKKSHSKEYENPQMEAICESIMDTLVGDLKNQVTLTDADDGKKQIGINLDKSEIPALFNLMLNVKHDEEVTDEFDTNNKIHEILGINPIDFESPDLTSNVQAEEIDVKILIGENNIIEGMDLEFEVTGNDAQNQMHRQELKLSFDISGINSTTADVIDLNGKEVQEISSEDFDCETN